MRAPAYWWKKPGAAAAVLSPFAAIYGAVAARRLAQPGTRVGIPVICVGNLTVGGAGKTPTAIAVGVLPAPPTVGLPMQITGMPMRVPGRASRRSAMLP